MRKRIINPIQQVIVDQNLDWLDLESLAEVELSSEDQAHPIENALMINSTSGWLAGAIGPQTIRLIFTEPLRLRRIRLNFVETELERTQEYVLRWSADHGQTFREIVRQQWHFSPQGSTKEQEEHRVEIEGCMVLELSITPDIGGGNAIASLALLQLA